MAKKAPTPPDDPPAPPAEYTVVARRYRPQQFAELIGQEHVARSLVNALQSGRVAHAYLFTGARGVGKTSAARILAKALNCVTGPTATPCDKCDSCLAVAAGEDVDVLEIDGASNNKVEEIRDLRQNVGFRPTRSRYKIYIIDEVHMLSTSAFNALLKTLEEPPPHVKFIFATTEVQKIPITILSRCQRFDFAHVGPALIFDQLKRIVAQEGHQADDDALRLIARRAAGSMRDSQSLLDQLLASAQTALTAEHVHAVLGTAGDDRVLELTAAILAHDPKTALERVSTWIDRGMQVSELVDQLIEHWRTLMLVRCSPDLRDLPVSPTVREILCQQAGNFSLDTILTGLDVWTTTKARIRGSSHAQVLLEMAVVRLSRLEDLVPISQLIQTLQQGGGLIAAQSGNLATTGSNDRMGGVSPGKLAGGGDSSKKNDLMGLADKPSASQNGTVGTDELPALTLSEETLPEVWNRFTHFLSERSPILAVHVKSSLSPAIFGPNSLAIRFPSGYTHAYEASATEQNVLRMQEVLRRVTGNPAIVRVDLVTGSTPAASRPVAPAPNQAAERRKQLMGLPLFKKAAEALGAQIWHVDEDFNPAAAPPKPPTPVDPDEA